MLRGWALSRKRNAAPALKVYANTAEVIGWEWFGVMHQHAEVGRRAYTCHEQGPGRAPCTAEPTWRETCICGATRECGIVKGSLYEGKWKEVQR